MSHEHISRQLAVTAGRIPVPSAGTVGRMAQRVRGDLSQRVVPNHWTSLFGAISMACFVVLTVTGVYLMFFYDPSNATVAYQGSYTPLQGIEVSRAFDSTMYISFEVRGGLLMRQAHHWAALVLPAALLLGMLGTFFTGGFRRPRRLAWVLLFLCFVLALAGGWSGYALPDDMLSGTGLRIVEGITIGIPVLGTWLTGLLFGGEFPGEIIAHLYWVHVLIVPFALVLVIAVRLRLAYLRGPAQFAGPGRTEANVVGTVLVPTAAAKAVGLFCIAIGVLFLMAATMTISPIWLYGPSSSGAASAGSQPDWYTGFLDGALRLVPPGWETHWWGGTWPVGVLVPLGVVAGFLTLVLAYPFIEERLTGDTEEHHLLDRPRNTPRRTATGVAGLVFFGTLWAAGSTDVMATQLHLSIEGLAAFLRGLLVLGPIVAFALTFRICLALQAQDREVLAHGVETGVIERSATGGYAEVHRPVDAYERWRRREPVHEARTGHRGSEPMHLNHDPGRGPMAQLPTDQPTEKTPWPVRAPAAEGRAP